MYQWQIKDFGKQSSCTGNPFSESDEIISLLYKNIDDKELVRIDLLSSELLNWDKPKNFVLLGKWEIIYSTEEKSISKQERMGTAEEFFISLFNTKDNENEIDERSLLKYLFAISLERNRILKSLSIDRKTGLQKYFHVKSKQEFSVPCVSPSKESVSKLESFISDLLV